jgi:plasmid stabilization system protein ParE
MRLATSNSEAKGWGGVSLLRSAERLIAQFPESAQEIQPGIRKHILQKFRYSLIYAIEKDGVLILAVAHHSRRPGYWVGRSGTRQP